MQQIKSHAIFQSRSQAECFPIGSFPRDNHAQTCTGLFVRQPKFKAWSSGGVYHCKEPNCKDKTPFQNEYR